MEKKKFFLSLDLGTQGTKAAIVDLDGHVLGSTFSANVFSESDCGAITLEAEALQQGVIQATRQLVEKMNLRPADILAIGVVGMMAGIVGIDENWQPLTHYDSGLDKRCESAIAQMQRLGEAQVIALCGSPIIVAQGAKMYWWKTEQPELFRTIKKFIPASTYICGCMAGLKARDAFIDYTHIHLTCFADIQKNQWSPELLELFDFPVEKLPRIVAPFEVVGHVTEQWSHLTGLCAGVPIVAGCGDTAASGLGAGLVQENMILDIAGTASCLAACVSEYVPDTEKKVIINQRSVIPGLWTPFGFVLGGQTMGWYLEQINFNGQYSFEALAQEAIGADTRGLYFLPYFAGRICPSDAACSGQWFGMKFYHGRGHMFKSIMESIAFEYQFYLDRMRDLYPHLQISEVLASAGGAKSEEFTQVKADVLKLPFVQLKQKDTSHKAAAILAGYGMGIYQDIGDTALQMCRQSRGRQIQPVSEKTAAYSARYENYMKIVSRMGALQSDIQD